MTSASETSRCLLQAEKMAQWGTSTSETWSTRQSSTRALRSSHCLGLRGIKRICFTLRPSSRTATTLWSSTWDTQWKQWELLRVTWTKLTQSLGHLIPSRTSWQRATITKHWSGASTPKRLLSQWAAPTQHRATPSTSLTWATTQTALSTSFCGATQGSSGYQLHIRTSCKS